MLAYLYCGVKHGLGAEFAYTYPYSCHTLPLRAYEQHVPARAATAMLLLGGGFANCCG